MLTLYLPYPPNSGGQIRSYNLIKNLSKTHEITLVSFIKKGEEKYASELRKYCREVLYFYRSDSPWTLGNILKTGLSPYPFLVIRNFSGAGKRAISEKIKKEKYDLIHVETFYLMPHVPATDIPILLVDQTIEFQVYQHFVDTTKWWLLRPLLYIDVFKLKYWETKFWRQAARVVAVSDVDAEVMREYVPANHVSIVPNAPGEDLADLYKKRKKPDFERPVIFFQSNFLWLQNIEGAEILIKKIFPLIKEKIPGARCLIAGQNIKGKINVSPSQDIELLKLETSDIEGVRQVYLRGTVFVAPLWGPGGTQLKILSAMATGVPVVTTPVRAKGIEVRNGEEVMVGSDASQLAEATIRVLTDRDLYWSLVEKARKYVEERYSWKAISQSLSKIYEETARKN